MEIFAAAFFVYLILKLPIMAQVTVKTCFMSQLVDQDNNHVIYPQISEGHIPSRILYIRNEKVYLTILKTSVFFDI